jgi:hypothetical protein
MGNITLTVPEDVHEIMRKHKEIRWSEIARASIIEHVRKLAMMDKITEKSKLTTKDIEEINKKIKKGLHASMKE